jgi:hypothetical protein
VDFIRNKELADINFSVAWRRENYNPAISQFYSLIDGEIKQMK